MSGTAILKTPEQIKEEKKGASLARETWASIDHHTQSELANDAVTGGIDWSYFRDLLETDKFMLGFKKEIRRLIDERIDAQNYGFDY